MRMHFVSLALMASLGLTACATGPMNGYARDPMEMVWVHKNPDYGQMTETDYKVAKEHVNSCFDDLIRSHQISSPGESIATGAALYGVPALLAAPTALSAMKSPTQGLPMEIGALNAVNGGVYGAIANSNARAGAVGSCAAEDLKDSNTMALAPGMHVGGITVRTKNSSKDTLPSWASKASTSPPPAPSNQ